LAAANLGKVSRGAEQLTSSLGQYGDLARKMKEARIEDDILNEDNSAVAQLKLSLEYFRNGITRSSVISYDGDFDNHSPDDAKEQSEEFTKLSADIAAILQTLKDTPYDDKRSFFDLTTLMVASEFSRTMRQQQLPIDATGTDHNPLNNSFIFAGKGIQGDMVIGSSDFMSETENLSAAHLALDPDRLKCMGRPFDFATGLSKPVVPNSYSIHDYLNAPSVINTVYSLFSRSTGVDLLAGNALKIDRNTVVAPVVEQLLKL